MRRNLTDGSRAQASHASRARAGRSRQCPSKWAGSTRRVHQNGAGNSAVFVRGALSPGDNPLQAMFMPAVGPKAQRWHSAPRYAPASAPLRQEAINGYSGDHGYAPDFGNGSAPPQAQFGLLAAEQAATFSSSFRWRWTWDTAGLER
jgi:hypothetical protein